MSVDAEALLRLLVALEADVGRAGWDQPAAGLTLFVLYDETAGVEVNRVLGPYPLGEPVGAGRYAGWRLLSPVHVEATARYPGAPPLPDMIRWHAECWGFAMEPRQDGIRRLLRLPGVVGFAAFAEVYRHHPATGESEPPVRRGFACDVDDRAYGLMRDPRGRLSVAAADDLGALSPVLDGLRLLVDLAVGRVPFGGAPPVSAPPE